MVDILDSRLPTLTFTVFCFRNSLANTDPHFFGFLLYIEFSNDYPNTNHTMIKYDYRLVSTEAIAKSEKKNEGIGQG